MTALTVLQNVRTIHLSRGHVALVDTDDYSVVSHLKWHVAPTPRGNFYAVNCRPTGCKPKNIAMQRFLMGSPVGMEVDHKNGDTLDNRRSNLRVCTSVENRRNKRTVSNRFGFKGVSKNCSPGSPTRYAARIMINRKTICLGTFATPEQAARAYDAAAKERFGEFAATNSELFGVKL